MGLIADGSFLISCCDLVVLNLPVVWFWCRYALCVGLVYFCLCCLLIVILLTGVDCFSIL